MALDIDTARVIVEVVCADLSVRRSIENSRPPSPMLPSAPLRFMLPAAIDSALESMHWAGGARNAAMILRGMGPKDDEFVRLSCVGIAEATKTVIVTNVVNGKLPKVRSSYTAMRTVNGYAHKGTNVAMRDGTEYVFDWWPTLNARNPLVSSRAEWLVAGKSVEYKAFKGFL